MTIARKTVLQLGLILFFSLCLLEIGMRVLGRGILAIQEVGNEIRSEDSTALRILTVGESTTADFFSTDSRNSWPRQLEAKLQDKGIKARVYNVARPATTTSHILERLPEQLDYFNPNIVISMMGINDGNTLFTRDQSGWDNLRIFKLYRTVIAKWKQPDEFPPKNFFDSETTEAILKSLQSADIGPAFSLIERQTKTLNETERAQFFSFLAHRSSEYQFSNQTQIEFLEWALKERFQGGTLLLELVDLHRGKGDTERCFDLASRFVDKGWFANDVTLFYFTRCANVSIRKNSNSKEKWWTVLSVMSGGDARFETLREGKLKERSHRALHKLLAERKIFHIEMQYATRPIEHLKNYFVGESGKIEKDFQDIIFVENKENFANALQRFPYEKIFSDRFGGTFGHTTDLGHSIYAEAALPAVLEAVDRVAK